jgi:outer membrane protein assembly factor BamB
MRTSRLVVLLGLCLALGACGIFSDKKDKSLEPVELEKFKATLKIKRLWSAKVGGDAEHLRVALRPAGDGARIYAASKDGNVSAFDPESGRRLWRTELDVELSAGPGVGEGLVALAGTNGDVVLLDGADGSIRWTVNVGGESLARPLITDGAVFIQTVDNRLRALQVFDGGERWVHLESMPALTMRGSASPVISGGNVVAGFDNGYVVALNPDNGDVAWRSLLSPPSGRSDLERLSDVDGAMVVIGQDIYAAGYQGRVGAIAAESGQLLWSSEISSYVGVSADWNSLFTTQDTGAIVAIARRNGAEVWRQEALLRREPTLPVPFNTTVVVGDYEGYLHFFSNLDGELVARAKLDSTAISVEPLVVADRLYVQSDAGRVSAYEIVPPKRDRSSPDVASEETPTEEGS